MTTLPIDLDTVDVAPARGVNTATAAQTTYIADLIAQRELGLEELQLVAAARVAWQASTFSKDEASEVIDALKACPRRPRAAGAYTGEPLPDVAEGRYALRDVPGYANEIAFFKVDRPTEGKWAGYTFVNQFKSDEELPVRGDGARKVLTLIAADPRAAMQLFGQESEHCGHCGRRLTNDVSRARGIGPDCAELLGW